MKINKICAGISIAAAGILAFSLFCMHAPKRVITLPAPTGPYAVGTTDYHFVDRNRKETKAPTPDTYRELMIHVWWPAEIKFSSKSTELYPYLSQEMPHVKQIIFETTDVASMSQLHYLDAPMYTYSAYNAPISKVQNKYPVLIFSHGLGTCFARIYTTLMEELASHGYIIVAIDHTYDNLVSIFPGNRVVKTEAPKEEAGKPTECPVSEQELLKIKTEHLDIWVKDIQFVLNEIQKINTQDPKRILTDKLDLEHIGIFGHSWGGAAAAQVCRVDTRCKAGMNIDGALQGKGAELPFDKPFLFLLAGKTFELGNYPPAKMLAQLKLTKLEFDKMCESMLPPILHSLENLFDHLTNDAYWVFLKKAEHLSFSDYPLLLPTQAPDTIKPLKGIELTRQIVRGFFDVYLKNHDKAEFIAMLKQIPETTVKTKIMVR